MPYSRKRRYKRSYGRRYKRRYNARKKVMVSPYKELCLTRTIPNSLCVWLKYAPIKNAVLTQSGLTFKKVSLIGNSVFNCWPIASGGTSDTDQPTGFDQWKAFYTRYRVIGSKIRVKFLNNGQVKPENCYVIPVRTDADITTELTARQQQRVAWSTSLPNAVKPIQINKYQSTHGMFPGLASTDDNLQALISASPATIWDWVVAASNTTATTTTNQIVYITVMYYVQFFATKILNEA